VSGRGEAEIRQDAAMWALVAELKGHEADLEGLKAENAARLAAGGEPAYLGEQFWGISKAMRDIAERLRKEI